MRVAVTGACGHIGANLVRALLGEGREVRALIHDDARAIEGLSGVEAMEGDVLEIGSIMRAFRDVEVVYHLAARISITGDRDGMVHAVNVIGTRNVVEACLRAGVRRLVHFSSVHALCQTPFDEPMHEGRALALDAELPYDRAKAQAEVEVLAGVRRGLSAVIVNPAAVIGPYDFKPSPMGEVFLKLYRRSLPALVDGGFSWVDVRDVVRGAIAAEELGRPGERYLLGGHFRTIRQLADLAAQVTGVAAPRMSTPMWLAHAFAPVATAYARLTGQRPLYTTESLKVLSANLKVSTEKARRELGYRVRPLEESIEGIYGWLREDGRL